MTQTGRHDGDALRKRVVEGGYCIGCGLCAALSGAESRMELDRYGLYRPRLVEPGSSGCEGPSLWDVCPFGEQAATEDEVATELFASDCLRHPALGYYAATYAGHVREGTYRERGSSGGLGSWVPCELLRRGMVDAVVHVKSCIPDARDGRLFRYAVSESVEAVREGAKSRYYPVELSAVARWVRERPGCYAVVGLPCFVKGLRLLGRADRVVRKRVRFLVGLVCGHLKSTRFADLFAWQCGIAPEALRAIDFRMKLAGRKAYQYGVEVVGERDGNEVREVRPNTDFFGHSWGHGLLKYPACDYCDDVFAETADLTLGDAWLKPYTVDSRGGNVVVVRHPELGELLEAASGEGRLALERLSPRQVARSQDAGLRHRREGTAYRLWLKEQRGEWHPPKRVRSRRWHLSSRRREILRLRMELATASHEAFLDAVAAERFDVFRERMTPLLDAYDRLCTQRHPLRRLLSSISRWVRHGWRRRR